MTRMGSAAAVDARRERPTACVSRAQIKLRRDGRVWIDTDQGDSEVLKHCLVLIHMEAGNPGTLAAAGDITLLHQIAQENHDRTHREVMARVAPLLDRLLVMRGKGLWFRLALALVPGRWRDAWSWQWTYPPCPLTGRGPDLPGS